MWEKKCFAILVCDGKISKTNKSSSNCNHVNWFLAHHLSERMIWIWSFRKGKNERENERKRLMDEQLRWISILQASELAHLVANECARTFNWIIAVSANEWASEWVGWLADRMSKQAKTLLWYKERQRQEKAGWKRSSMVQPNYLSQTKYMSASLEIWLSSARFDWMNK